MDTSIKASLRLVRAGALATALTATPAMCANGAGAILDMDSVRHRPTTIGKDERAIGTVEVVPGKLGQACRFEFVEGAKSGFFTAGVRASEEWDRAQGISFWVKGDGSASWGGLELIDRSNYALRYGYCFPTDSTEWRKITVPWCDLVPELPAGQLVDPVRGYRPSGFGNVWFGKWFYWREYPAHSFSIDHIALETRMAVDRTDHTPPVAGTPVFLAKLRAGKPVTIVTMGDSLSDKHHWANRELLWSELLAEKLRERFGSKVDVANPAIGGTLLTQNLVLMPRWLRDTPKPDLVTVWFGYNDWDSGMRGGHFRRMLSFAVERIRRMTGGKSEVLLLTTCPADGRWDAMEELAEAVRTVAAEKRTGLADVAAAFHEAGGDSTVRKALFARDQTHLGTRGHELAAQTVLAALVGEGRSPEAGSASVRRLSGRRAGDETAPAPAPAGDGFGPRRPVPREHPRLLGSRAELQRLARERNDAFKRVVSVAREQEADAWAKLVSMALVSAVEEDGELGRRAVDRILETVDGPIRRGHVAFGSDLARCAVVYDLCHDQWTPEERSRFHSYVNRTVDANVKSEMHVFHNGWYGYKHWGIGVASYAAYHENERAREHLRNLEEDYRTRAAPALELAGNGGGWAEGYYVNYWLYEWLFFCEVARRCEGVDYYALAPGFFGNRAVAGMFETYPGIGIYHSRRPIPMGDGGGRLFGGDRDKAVHARRILVNRYREQASHRAVHTFNETTPRSSVGVYAYKDFLWRDTTVPQGDLAAFRLSHVSPGPGYVSARSSWDEDATFFFFKCGDRFTAHQHLDNGHFLIYRHGELAGDGGHYDGFGTAHDVNVHLRTIAHSTILVHDPAETWPGIRAGKVTGNDGGQHHNWPHHNGAVVDPKAWHSDRDRHDIADLPAFEDTGEYLYVAGDCTRSYSSSKLEHFTRQIVFVRPGTFVVFDRVVTTKPTFRKTWLLQAAKPPTGASPNLMVTNGKGRLFVQTLLPERADVALRSGADLHAYGGNAYPPARNTGPAPECRIEVSPSTAAREDLFLHVLTATDATVEAVPVAAVEETGDTVRVQIGDTAISFRRTAVGGYVEADGARRQLGGKAGPRD